MPGGSGGLVGRGPGAASAAAAPSLTPLCVNDLETSYPTRVSSLKSRRHAAEAAVRRAMIDDHAAAAGSTLGHADRLPVRLLLEGEDALPADAKKLQVVASATAGQPLYGYGGGVSLAPDRPQPPLQHGPSRPRHADVLPKERVRFGATGGHDAYVPDPRLTMRDPWRASEEDLRMQRAKQDMAEDLHTVRLAAAVGLGAGVVPGFC